MNLVLSNHFWWQFSEALILGGGDRIREETMVETMLSVQKIILEMGIWNNLEMADFLENGSSDFDVFFSLLSFGIQKQLVRKKNLVF